MNLFSRLCYFKMLYVLKITLTLALFHCDSLSDAVINDLNGLAFINFLSWLHMLKSEVQFDTECKIASVWQTLNKVNIQNE